MADPQTTRAERLLCLVQHGEAVPKTENPDRPLADAGRRAVERVAAWVARAGIRVDQIRHSGKLRAQQTAAIFAEKLQPRRGVIAQPGLAPNDDVQPVAEAVVEWPGPVMVVGHLPFLSRLAGLMLTGDAEREPVRFCYGGLVGLVREGEQWQVACAVPPELVAER